MIFNTSRYAKVETYTVTPAAGRTLTALKLRVIPPTSAVFWHTVQAGDRLDLLAFKYYGKADRFWLICDANNVMRPEELLQPGRKILIPPDRTG